MGIRRTLTCAAGAFLMTTVLFAAAMVIAHGLIIPDPVGRVLPMAGQERADAASEDATEQVALVKERAPKPPSAPDDVPELIAVPVPDDDVAMADNTDPDTPADTPDPAADRGDSADAADSNGDPVGGSSDAAPEREVTRTRPPTRDDSDEERPPSRHTSPPTAQPPAGQGDDDDDRHHRWDPRDDDDRHHGWYPPRDDDDERFKWNAPRGGDDRTSMPGFFDFFRRQADDWPSERDSFERRDDHDGWHNGR